MTETAQDLLRRAVEAHRAGHIDEAEAVYEQVLALDPADHNALTNLGAVFLQRGRLPEGLALIDRSLVQRPDQPNAVANKASALAGMGRLDEALAVLEGASRLDDGGVALAVQIGDALRQADAKPRALQAYDLARRWRPDQPDILNRCAVALGDLGRYDAARAQFEALLATHPGHVQAWCNLGSALNNLQRFEDAIAAFEGAMAHGMDPAEGDLNIAAALRELGRQDEALAAIDRAVAAGARPAAHCDRGLILLQMQRVEEAAAAFEAAVALEPDNPFWQTNLGMAHLAAGRFTEGWSLLEARWRSSMRAAFPGLPRPLWLGERNVAGLTVLLVAEQGLGDTLQFVRYAALVAARGARVILAVQPNLVELCRSVAGVAEVVRDDQPPPAFDLCCPLMSLPHMFGTTVDAVPADTPYIHAPPAKVRAWADRLGPRSRPRVGLVWSGAVRPGQPEYWVTNSRRNIALARLAPLAHADVDFHSLQIAAAPVAELAGMQASGWDGPQITDWSAELRDFSDTAALIENLDLVISVDTSVAHLAGALGKPVWIMNRFDSCWRWMLHRPDSPWYPTARLFRQPAFAQWGGVFDDIGGALDAWSRAQVST